MKNDGWMEIEMVSVWLRFFAIKDVLWNQRENSTILRVGDKSVDVESFSSLVGEHYLDNFVIDMCILRFLQDFQGRSKDFQGRSKALCLPSETHTVKHQQHPLHSLKALWSTLRFKREWIGSPTVPFTHEPHRQTVTLGSHWEPDRQTVALGSHCHWPPSWAVNVWWWVQARARRQCSAHNEIHSQRAPSAATWCSLF